MTETFDLRAPEHPGVIGPPLEQGKTRDCIAHALVATVEGRVRFLDRAALGLPSGAAPELDVEDFLGTVGPSDSLMVHRNAAEREGIARRDTPGQPRLFPTFDRCRGVPKMQEALRAHGPLLVVMRLYDDFKDFTGPGLYVPAGQHVQEGHAASIVGYSGASREPGGHWILKNSYGTEWGDGGFFRVPYRLRDLKMENGAHFVVSVRAGNAGA